MGTSNIVLAGFMGTGKSTVGRLVAEALAWPFVDADQEIVRMTGRSIPAIFEQEGEAGFRRREKALCLQLASREGQVIATGGGMLLDPESRAAMLKTGLVVCLTAEPEIIRSRLADFEGRPLAPDWENLLALRQVVYAALPYQIDTSHRTPDEVAQEVVNLWKSQ